MERPLGRGPTTRSSGDETDYHGYWPLAFVLSWSSKWSKWYKQDTKKTWKLKILLGAQFPIHPLALNHPLMTFNGRAVFHRLQDTWQLVIQLAISQKLWSRYPSLKQAALAPKNHQQQTTLSCLRMVFFSWLSFVFLGWYCLMVQKSGEKTQMLDVNQTFSNNGINYQPHLVDAGW